MNVRTLIEKIIEVELDVHQLVSFLGRYGNENTLQPTCTGSGILFRETDEKQFIDTELWIRILLFRSFRSDPEPGKLNNWQILSGNNVTAERLSNHLKDFSKDMCTAYNQRRIGPF